MKTAIYILVFTSLLLQSCGKNSTNYVFGSNKTQALDLKRDVVYVTLDEGERLEDVSFNPNDGHMYILTKMDTTKPEVHYVQEFRKDRLLEIKLIVKEQ